MLSGSNPRVRLARALVARRKDRWEERAFVVQGETLLVEALSAGWHPRFLLRRGDVVPGRELAALLGGTADGAEMFEVEGPVFDELNDTTTPQAILGVFEMPADEGPKTTTSDWYIVADQVADPGNLGTIIRSAEAAGASGVVLTRGTVDPYSPKSVRASAGALFHVRLHFAEDLSDEVLDAMDLIGTTSHGDEQAESLWDADLSGCVGFVFGNEPRGIGSRAPIRSWVSIPHAGRSESLNVAMAASVVAMYVAHVRSPEGAAPGKRQPGRGGASD